MLKTSYFLLLILQSVLSQTTDKYSDEDRPYKFGFNIQGYQHRQEEKDERGLIKGEYGFITADGYYRVTVYATDENGDFKILSMKNYYVGFPPEDPTTTPQPPQRSGNATPLSAFNAPSGGSTGSSPPRPGAQAGGKPVTPFVRPQGLAACSDCSIPTTTTRPSLANQNVGGRFGGAGGQGFGQGPSSGQTPQSGPLNNQTPFTQTSPRANSRGPLGETPSRFPASGPNAQQTPGGFGSGGPGGFGSGGPGGFKSGGPSGFGSGGPGGFGSGGSGGFGSGGSTGTSGPGSALGGGNQPGGGSFGSGGPTSPGGRNDFTQNNQLGDSPRRRPQIGEVREGLPPGVTLNDIKDLLYTFNYTVGFHGHHEDGYRNGDKEGDYFFDGRDGVERKVVYLANEFGYQPNITFVDLPENDIRRPNEQTEKEYGLKGYEFKWFYRR